MYFFFSAMEMLFSGKEKAFKHYTQNFDIEIPLFFVECITIKTDLLGIMYFKSL